MRLHFSGKDILIAKGIEELRSVASADVWGAHGFTADRVLPSVRTLELYPEIVEALEIDRDL